MRIVYLGLCAMSLLLHGCAGFEAASSDGTNEGTWGSYPITDGFRTSLPKPAE